MSKIKRIKKKNGKKILKIMPELIQLINEVSNVFDFKIDLIVEVKNINKGYSNATTKTIELPSWIFTSKRSNINFIKYYVIHETLHQINYDKFNCNGHDALFFMLEKFIMVEYNLFLEYENDYPSRIRDRHGNILWNRHKIK